MQTECSADLFGFASVERRAVVAGFDGGRMTSDAGAWVAGGNGSGDRIGRAVCGVFHRLRRSGTGRA